MNDLKWWVLIVSMLVVALVMLAALSWYAYVPQPPGR
jgi:hypothetical protein